MSRKKLSHQEYVKRHRPDSLITQYEEEIQRLTSEKNLMLIALRDIVVESEICHESDGAALCAHIAQMALDLVLPQQRKEK